MDEAFSKPTGKRAGSHLRDVDYRQKGADDAGSLQHGDRGRFDPEIKDGTHSGSHQRRPDRSMNVAKPDHRRSVDQAQESGDCRRCIPQCVRDTRSSSMPRQNAFIRVLVTSGIAASIA